VVDTAPPEIMLRGDSVVTLEMEMGSKYEEPGYTADDNHDGDITGKVVVEGSVDHTKRGEYTLVYRVSDSSENEARRERAVHVVDTRPPYIVDLSPAKGAENVPVGTNVTLRVKDDGVGVDKQTIEITLNGQGVISTITEGEDSYLVRYDPPAYLQEDQAIRVTADAVDLSGNKMETEAHNFKTGRLPVITSHPESKTAMVGDRVTFRAAARKAVSYQWMKNGEAIEGADRGDHTIASVQRSDEGSYMCVLSNLVGSRKTQPANLTVNDREFSFKAFWKEYAGDFRDPEKFKKHYSRPERDLKWYSPIMGSKPDKIELKQFTPQGGENGNIAFEVHLVAHFMVTDFLRGRRVTEPRSEVWVIDPNKSKIIEIRNE